MALAKINLTHFLCYIIMGVYVWYFVVYIYILKSSIAISIYSDAQYHITRFIYMYMYIHVHVLQSLMCCVFLLSCMHFIFHFDKHLQTAFSHLL